MRTHIRSIATSFAVLIFFVMAVVGWFTGLSPATACSRAVIGAVITYITVSWAAKGVINVIINEIIKSKISEANQKDKQ
jgi:ABC-type uncharacterized transport system permease subunit